MKVVHKNVDTLFPLAVNNGAKLLLVFKRGIVNLLLGGKCFKPFNTNFIVELQKEAWSFLKALH
jgi:hypothetical protein